jgi:hypothetical protein
MFVHNASATKSGRVLGKIMMARHRDSCWSVAPFLGMEIEHLKVLQLTSFKQIRTVKID